MSPFFGDHLRRRREPQNPNLHRGFGSAASGFPPTKVCASSSGIHAEEAPNSPSSRPKIEAQRYDHGEPSPATPLHHVAEVPSGLSAKSDALPAGIVAPAGNAQTLPAPSIVSW